jgi:hypothetical protein
MRCAQTRPVPRTPGRRACRLGWWYRLAPASCGTRPPRGQPGDDVDSVAQRPAQPVQLPDHQAVAWARRSGSARGWGGWLGCRRRARTRRPTGAAAGRRWRRGVAEQVAKVPRVAQPCDRSGSATLIADTGCGRSFTVQRRGREGCRRIDRFRTVHRRLGRGLWRSAKLASSVSANPGNRCTTRSFPQVVSDRRCRRETLS